MLGAPNKRMPAFSARCYAERRYCHGKSSVCSSVCPPETLRYCGHIIWVNSKIIAHIVRLASSLSTDLNIINIYSNGNNFKFQLDKYGRYEKGGFSKKAVGQMYLKQGKTERKLLLTVHISSYTIRCRFMKKCMALNDL